MNMGLKEQFSENGQSNVHARAGGLKKVIM